MSFCPVTVYSMKQFFLDAVYSDGPWWWCVFPGSWHNTQWAFQPRFIMVHKHTRPQCRKASASLYFCPHVKSVNEEPLLFGLMPSAGITFFVTLTNFSVQRSSQRRELEHCVIETIHYAEARRIAASSGGQEKDAFSYPELSKYDLCTVATSWYIHTSLREPFSDSHFLTLLPNL